MGPKFPVRKAEDLTDFMHQENPCKTRTAEFGIHAEETRKQTP